MRPAAGLAFALALAGAAASGQPRPGREGAGPARLSYADPSAVIAADIALGRIGREKGQWNALHAAAAPGAVLFAPGPVDALSWLKRQPEPAEAKRWQARTVWMSCDGGFAVTRGAWSRGPVGGEYIAVWQRQPKGGWKWLVREEALPSDLGEAPDMISGQVAECSGLPRRGPPPEGALGLEAADSASRDQSLRWSIRADASCARTISVQTWDGKALATVYVARRDVPAGGCA